MKRNHIAPALVGLCALLVASFNASPAALLERFQGDVVDIGVEHELPLSLLLEVGINGESAVYEFYSQSPETILLSVPSTWIRREVRNAPIHTVTAEAPSLGFTRWNLPARAGISFKVHRNPDSVILHNPSGIQMKLNMSIADVQREEVVKDVKLIQGHTAKLW